MKKDVQYDPRSAIRVLQGTIAKQERSRVRIPKKGEILTHKGEAYTPVTRPATFCFLLLAWVAGTCELPADFAAVEKTAKGLQAHIRPDGATYLGTFELPNDPASCVVMYGDPLMNARDAIELSLGFRQRLLSKDS